ncbi:TetR/AcrR family transcriptional regulator [Actinocorallia aurea]
MPDREHDGRADRRRNRGRIVAAARSMILAKGRGVGMDEIAAEAGLAVGTLYRHFATKDELIEAILSDLAEEIIGLVESFERRLAARHESAVDLLESLLRTVVLDLSTARMLREALDGSEARLRVARSRATALMTDLVEAAHRDGALHGGVSAGDVVLLLRTAPGGDLPRAERERWLQIMLTGLRTAEAGVP